MYVLSIFTLRVDPTPYDDDRATGAVGRYMIGTVGVTPGGSHATCVA